MSSTIFQPRNKFISQNVGTSYNDVEEFAQTSQIPLLDFTNLHIIKKIGKGGYATVFVATYNGIKIACKDVTQLFGDELNEELKHVFCRESLQLQSLHHPNIIHFYGICIQPPSLYLVLELATHGTLRNLLDLNKRNILQQIKKKNKKKSYHKSINKKYSSSNTLIHLFYFILFYFNPTFKAYLY